MTDQNKLELGEIRTVVAAAIQAHWKLFLAEGVVIALLGLLAVATPLYSSLLLSPLPKSVDEQKKLTDAVQRATGLQISLKSSQ